MLWCLGGCTAMLNGAQQSEESTLDMDSSMVLGMTQDKCGAVPQNLRIHCQHDLTRYAHHTAS
jgi:hypothetical protein